MKLIKHLGTKKDKKGKSRKYSFVKCIKCGEEKEILTQNYNLNPSAVCKNCRKKSYPKHGESFTKIYRAWADMKTRCNCISNKFYKNYGGRGIKVCDDWMDYENFRDWAIINGHSEDLSLDRIDCNGNYEPLNCRWTDNETQARNKSGKMSTNSSGFIGVYWSKRDKKWQSRIVVSGKYIYLGVFEDKKQAALERDRYVIENNLEHTLNNIIEG